MPPEARQYWAFRKPIRRSSRRPRQSANPIDRFLEKTRLEKGLNPAPRADRITLFRRAYLDLIGLPPTPAEAAAFLADTSPRAWENLIDRLLASPHYGERWGRHWLDVARYADSSGFEHDFDRPERLALSRLRDPRLQPGQALQSSSLPSRSPATNSTTSPTTA